MLLTTGSTAASSTSLVAAEKVTIFTPREDRSRSRAGSILVRGAAWLDEDLPLLVEIIDRQGQMILASAEVPLAAPASAN